MKLMLTLLAMVASAGLTLTAADLSGKWSGTLAITRSDGASRTLPSLAALKQEGSVLTGTVGSADSDQRPFRNGKVDGDRLTFEIESPNGTVQRFELKASATAIDGEVRAVTPDGERAAGRLSLKRATGK